MFLVLKSKLLSAIPHRVRHLLPFCGQSIPEDEKYLVISIVLVVWEVRLLVVTMKTFFSHIKNSWIFGLFLTVLFWGVLVVTAQSREVGGLITTGDLNAPGVGGIKISVKGTSTATVSDNDGEYRIDVLGDESMLVYTYPGMISQEIVVGAKSRIDVDLIKLFAEKVQTVYATRVHIVLNENASPAEQKVAGVLQTRLQSNSKVAVSISKIRNPSASLQIYLGIASKVGRLNELCKEHHIRLPGISKPVAEGYAVKMVTLKNAPAMIAVGADSRGVLYAAGEILRRRKVDPLAVRFTTFNVSTAPAYRFRGGNASQGGTMRKHTSARAWTTEEWEWAILDSALAGANCFNAGWSGGERYDFLKSFDLMTIVGIRPNQMTGDFPKEWKAGGLSDWEGSNWVCPNIPEARQALLKQWSKKLGNLAKHDLFVFYAGDPGGCRDERCKPWGNTFVHLCEEISEFALQSHPDLKILIANQDLSNAGDRAIFQYLSEKPRTWAYGIYYGPGSNAMSWYFRHELNEEMFEYPGYGWLSRYMAETLNSIPRDKKIVNYSDITHWILAQYNVENPERNIAKSFGRRTWHTRPLALHKISQAIMPFSQGDIIYTEGYHDHFNQYFWYRLLWNSHRSAQEVVQEYCQVFFGEKSASLMAQAIFQLEQNLETPLVTNAGIDRYYALVQEAGRNMPENRMEKNHYSRSRSSG